MPVAAACPPLPPPVRHRAASLSLSLLPSLSLSCSFALAALRSRELLLLLQSALLCRWGRTAIASKCEEGGTEGRTERGKEVTACQDSEREKEEREEHAISPPSALRPPYPLLYLSSDVCPPACPLSARLLSLSCPCRPSVLPFPHPRPRERMGQHFETF